MSDSVLTPVRRQFRALAITLVPEIRALDAAAWRTAEEIIDTMLRERSPSVRRQVGLFVRALNLLPVLRYGHTFLRLDEGRRLRFVQALEHAPLLAVRRGVWGLRTLVFMGYYAQTGVRASLGYRAHPGAWTARNAAGSAPPANPANA